MITDPIKYNPETGKCETYECVLDDLYCTGAAVPDITRVQYQFGMKKFYKTDENGEFLRDADGKRVLDAEKSYPALTTLLTFADGSTSIVLNSKADGLQLDENGQPTEIAKEIGLLYAFAKRVLSGKLEISDDGKLCIKYAFGSLSIQVMQKRRKFLLLSSLRTS